MNKKINTFKKVLADNLLPEPQMTMFLVLIFYISTAILLMQANVSLPLLEQTWPNYVLNVQNKNIEDIYDMSTAVERFFLFNFPISSYLSIWKHLFRKAFTLIRLYCAINCRTKKKKVVNIDTFGTLSTPQQ